MEQARHGRGHRFEIGWRLIPVQEFDSLLLRHYIKELWVSGLNQGFAKAPQP